MNLFPNPDHLLQGVAATPDIPPYQTIALVLQGGGALGAYQAGVYEGLCEASIVPNCLSGISIGALNIAVIAGNRPENRLSRLKEFWETICRPAAAFSPLPFFEKTLFNLNEMVRNATGAMGATSAMVNGQKGFFRPRFPPPSVLIGGDPRTASYYDTSDLKHTLERLCDFDLINSGKTHVSLGAVNVRTGNFAYFDNTRMKLRAEHFMASGALPPAFAAVEIDGEYYWDGGLVSNTPLAYVLETHPAGDALAFQVDLWSARGRPPVNMGEVSDRMKEIQYSSRTRLITDHLHKIQELRHTMSRMLDETIAGFPADEQPPGSWWLPARHGGTAPTLERAAEMDVEERRERARRKAEKAAERRKKKK